MSTNQRTRRRPAPPGLLPHGGSNGAEPIDDETLITVAWDLLARVSPDWKSQGPEWQRAAQAWREAFAARVHRREGTPPTLAEARRDHPSAVQLRAMALRIGDAADVLNAEVAEAWAAGLHVKIRLAADGRGDDALVQVDASVAHPLPVERPRTAHPDDPRERIRRALEGLSR